MMRIALEEDPKAAMLIAINAGKKRIVASTMDTEAIAQALYEMTQKRNDSVGKGVYEICKLVACNIVKDDNIKGLRMRIALNNVINDNYE